MNTLDIQELSRRWYNYVCMDHHKDRDCHFYVEKKWSYGEEPVYYAYHYGYRAHEWHSGPHLTAADAEEALRRWLTHTINGTIMDIKERLATPQEDLWTQSHEELREELDALEGR
jgi:hypothetical protein